MFYVYLCTTLFLFFCFIIIRLKKIIVEPYVENDILISVFDKIPEKLLEHKIGISKKQEALCMFDIKKVPKKNPIIGYNLDSDIPYLNAYQNIFDFQTKKISSFDDKYIEKCDIVFMKVDLDTDLYNDFNSKYKIFKVDISRPHINFWLPFSKKRKILNVFDNKLVDVLFIPRIVINPKEVIIDEDRSKIFNIHLGIYDNKYKIPNEPPLINSFNINWWNTEQYDQAEKINFQLEKYEFKELNNKKTLIVHDIVMLVVGDRIILRNQNDVNMNDYYYVLSSYPIVLKNYLPKNNDSFKEFTLIKGDRILDNNIIKIYQQDGIYKNEKLPLKEKTYYDCVNKNDYSVATSYLTKEACESDYDVYGNKRLIDTMWFKRCRNNNECEYYGQSRNKFRGGCINGLCDKPLTKDGNILYYGSDPKDHVYKDDVNDRIYQNLKPILNLNNIMQNVRYNNI